MEVEFVVGVDRKSQDRTSEIAKKYADIYFTFDFHDDFSEIRNQLIERSNGEWILISDGHEIWHGIENVPDIILKAPEGVNAFAFLLRMNPEEGSTIGQQLRLFKNGCGAKYTGAVHNRLSVDNNNSLVTDEVWIYHDRKDKLRGERYVHRKDMLKKRMEEVLAKDPNDPRALYYLGTWYLSESAEKNDTGKIVENASINPESLKSAIQHLHKYIEVSDFYEERYLAKWYLAQAYFHLDDRLKTKEVAYDMVEMMLEMPLGQEILGELFMDEYKKSGVQRYLALAEFWFKNARSKKVPLVSCFFPEPFFTWLPWERLVEIYSIAAQKEPKRILDAILAAEKTLEFDDLPDSRRENLERTLNQWKGLLDGSSDSHGARDREFDNVNTIDTGSSEKVSNKGGRFNPADLERVEPDTKT